GAARGRGGMSGGGGSAGIGRGGVRGCRSNREGPDGGVVAAQGRGPVMSGKVKILPAPPRRQCQTRVGEIPQPKRANDGGAEDSAVTPAPPSPQRRLRASALKRG